MKKSRVLLPILLASVAMGLSSCGLYSDKNLEISNHFNSVAPTSQIDPNAVIAGGVVGKEIEQVSNAYCFKNIGYAVDERIANTYKTGGVNESEYNPNNGEDYSGNKANNNFDLYVPKTVNKNAEHVVILFIHGGAWVTGFKADVNPYVYDFANRGYITANIKYTLLKRTMDDASRSIFRNLDEIDACIKAIKSALEDLEIDTSKSKLVIGGASSGAHLSMLYAYSRGEQSALPIKFVIDAVGPTDIKPDVWKKFNTASDEVLNAGIDKDAIAAQKAASNLGELEISGEGANWNPYQTVRIANGMCGIPFSKENVEACSSDKNAIDQPNAASSSMTKADGGRDQVSVTYWMQKKSNRFPIVCAYAGKDSVVGIAQYANLQEVMDDVHIEYDFTYFKESGHTEISKEKDATAYNDFVNKVVARCDA